MCWPEGIALLHDSRRHYIKENCIEDMTRFSRNFSLGLQWLKENKEWTEWISKIFFSSIDANKRLKEMNKLK